jgi:hypothetical protein
VNFIDSTLIRIAGVTTRSAVFDQEALAQMVAAAYDTLALAVSSPYSAVFDSVTLGMSVATVGAVEGTLRNELGAPATDIRLQVGGLGSLLPARVDALWSGSIIAQTVTNTSRIESVTAKFAVADIDAGIVQALGSLPSDPAAREAARRAAVMAELQAAMGHPTVLTDLAFNQLLAEIGVKSVGDLIAGHRGSMVPGVVQIRISGPAKEPVPTPKALPIVAAVLIRDTGFSVAELLMESKMLREQLMERGIDVPKIASLPALNPFLVVWAVPITVFDDAGWPGAGADNAALHTDRRHNASLWLGPEGIAVAGVS